MSGPALPPLQTIEVQGRTLAWREAGQGIPLVLVHGIGGHSGSWAEQFAAFADSFRVVEPELPADRLNSDMAFRKTWFQSFDVVRYLGWLSDGTLVMKYSTIGAPSTDSTFLVHMTADGRRLLETRTPGLLAIDRSTDSLYFVAPGADAPNRWIAAKLTYD